MKEIISAVAGVSEPLALGAIGLVVFLLIIRELLRKQKLFPTLVKADATKLLLVIVNRVFVLALVTIVLVVAASMADKMLGKSDVPQTQREAQAKISSLAQEVDSLAAEPAWDRAKAGATPERDGVLKRLRELALQLRGTTPQVAHWEIKRQLALAKAYGMSAVAEPVPDGRRRYALASEDAVKAGRRHVATLPENDAWVIQNDVPQILTYVLASALAQRIDLGEGDAVGARFDQEWRSLEPSFVRDYPPSNRALISVLRARGHLEEIAHP